MSTAICYTRTSTDDQRLSHEAQRRQMADYAARHGLTIARCYADEGVSGGAPLEQRAGLQEALQALREHGATVLLVAKRDRLARDVMLAAMLERLCDSVGVRIVAADGTTSDDTPEGQLLRTMVDAFAQYERALIRFRTRAALQVKRQRGEATGVPRIGERVRDGRIEWCPDEGAAVRLMRELQSSGLGVRAIAQEMNRRGVRARGRRWYPTTVSRALLRVV